jgi:hypothetical protein
MHLNHQGQVSPNPWEVFPEVDAGGLGSLQGNLEHWCQYCWWPYWISLGPQQRAEWLADTRNSEGWREYVRLQCAFNDVDREQI